MQITSSRCASTVFFGSAEYLFNKHVFSHFPHAIQNFIRPNDEIAPSTDGQKRTREENDEDNSLPPSKRFKKTP